jgi:hypothetical protein
MVSVLVSVSVPIVHHDTTPCLESFQVSVFEGAVAVKVISAPAFGALLDFRGLATNEGFVPNFFPTNILSLFILGPLLILAALFF